MDDMIRIFSYTLVFMAGGLLTFLTCLRIFRATYTTDRDIYRTCQILGEDIRGEFFKRERKQNEFIEQQMLYYKGIRDELRMIVEKIGKKEESAS